MRLASIPTIVRICVGLTVGLATASCVSTSPPAGWVHLYKDRSEWEADLADCQQQTFYITDTTSAELERLRCMVGKGWRAAP